MARNRRGTRFVWSGLAANAMVTRLPPPLPISRSFLNIVVCVKQTPIMPEAKFDEATKRLVRKRVTLSLSSIERRVLLEALRLCGQVAGGGQLENVPIVAELANALDGAVAASRTVAFAKWVSPQLQIGLTGRAIAPQFYLAVGVSGQANHMFGIRKAKYIIVINNEPKPPIFQSGDLGIVGDWAVLAPALTRAVLRAKARG